MAASGMVKSLLALCLMALCPACSNLSTAQREQIQSIRVGAVSETSKAYQKPAHLKPNEGLAVAVTGAVAPLVGPAMYGAIAQSNSQLPRPTKDANAAIKSLIPSDLNEMLRRELETSLRQTNYFGPRLNKKAPSQWTVSSTIVLYSLWKQNDGTYHPIVAANTRLIGPNGEKAALRINNCIPPSRQHPSAPLSDYLSKPGLLRAHFEEATHHLADNIARSLNEAATE